MMFIRSEIFSDFFFTFCFACVSFLFYYRKEVLLGFKDLEGVCVCVCRYLDGIYVIFSNVITFYLSMDIYLQIKLCLWFVVNIVSTRKKLI